MPRKKQQHPKPQRGLAENRSDPIEINVSTTNCSATARSGSNAATQHHAVNQRITIPVHTDSTDFVPLARLPLDPSRLPGDLSAALTSSAQEDRVDVHYDAVADSLHWVPRPRDGSALSLARI